MDHLNLLEALFLLDELQNKEPLAVGSNVNLGTRIIRRPEPVHLEQFFGRAHAQPKIPEIPEAQDEAGADDEPDPDAGSERDANYIGS